MEGGYIGQQPNWGYTKNGVWKLNDQFQRVKNNLWIQPDPFYNKVVLYLKADNSFEDSSRYSQLVTSNTGNQNITFSNTVFKYGVSSLYFNGGGLRYINPIFSFGLQDFCVECWVYIARYPNVVNIPFDFMDAPYHYGINIKSNGVLEYILSGSYYFDSIFLNRWVHFAITRKNNMEYFFRNGQILKQKGAACNITSNFMNLGFSYGWPFEGYIDSFRVTLGESRYSSNFNSETDTYLAY